jgi:hypothetical protein
MQMMFEEGTAEFAQLELPPDLLAAVPRSDKARHRDFKVDGWTPSFMERLARLLGLG